MWWTLATALAGEQAIAELEWTRAAPLALVGELPGASTAERIAIARALARSRRADAVEPLLGFRDDPEAEVRLAAAYGLGWLPGSADAVRGWLASLDTNDPVLRAEHAALLVSLGLQGSTRDLSTVLAGLEEPWPVGESAALALGHFGVRGLPALGPAVPALVRRLDAFDARIVNASAFALRRIRPSSMDHDDVERVLSAARRARAPQARAMLITAVWPLLESDARDALFIEGMTGSARLVRVALLDALRDGDMPGDVVQAWLVDPDPWVRTAALRALGRVGGELDLMPLTTDVSAPWRAAAAVSALGLGDPEIATDAEQPSVLRAAHAAALIDPTVLEELVADPDPMVRSGAAMAATAVADARTLRAAMWAADDPLVREIAALAVGEGAPIDELFRAANDERDPDVLAAMVEALTTRAGVEPRAVRAEDGRVSALLDSATALPSLRAQTAARALEAALGVEPRDAVPTALPSTFPLAGGAQGTRGAGWPKVAEVRRVVEAEVRTDRGAFVISLDPMTAPLAVHAFVTLAEGGFYDGLVMHRVEPGFVVQGGDPRGDGWGGPGWSLPDEVSELPFGAGAVGMARSGPDTAGSQWFVTTSPQPHLVGGYTRFGEVVQGAVVAARLPAGTVIEGITIVRDTP